jgi:psiF repeat
MTGDARQDFMSSCLSDKAAAENKKPQWVNGKPCANSYIAKDKVSLSAWKLRRTV